VAAAVVAAVTNKAVRNTSLKVNIKQEGDPLVAFFLISPIKTLVFVYNVSEKYRIEIGG
jgi:hypothetical protein